MKTFLIILAAVLVTAVIVVGGQVIGAGSTPTVSYDNQSSGLLSLDIVQPQDESVVSSTPLELSGRVSLPAQVTVNGLFVDVHDGQFSTKVDLEPGPNSIDVMATDGQGGQASKSISVVYAPQF